MKFLFLLLFSFISVHAEMILNYGVEWRLVHAGNIRLKWDPKEGSAAGEATLDLETQGVVARLYKVDNHYRSTMRDSLCAVSAGLHVHEGNRRRETNVNYDRERKHAFFLERDLLKNAVIREASVEIPPCVHDTVGGLLALRNHRVDLGQSITLPISDGKKFANVKITALNKETIRTPAGSFETVRHEVFLMNNVIYGRRGRVYVWMTDDDRRLPVQIQVRLPILIGTITLQLTKEEK